MSETVLYSEAAGIATITINRPDKLNALNQDVLNTLERYIEKAAVDSVKAVIITGAGDRAFVAGADIGQIQSLDVAKGKAFAAYGQSVFRKIELMTKPVIAAVNGFALGGGCELAMACHIRYAADTAQFGLPEVNLGLLPGYGGTQRLARLVGLGRALEMTLSGKMIDAAQAKAIGLANDVFPADLFNESVQKIAGSFARKAPLAISAILKTVYAGMDSDIDNGLKIEAAAFGDICNTEDMKEGTTAFLEKRKPDFKGC